ncbi:MAG: glycosyltransferase family 4 protein [Magnetococcales bacterium]|nr:glycosyltransferase family 4 protein [Magnetococcales bacterium]
MRIYLYQPLDFHFHSGVVLSVIHEYVHLARLGHEIFLYGTYEDEAAFREIGDYIGTAKVHLLVRKGPLARWRGRLKVRFLWSAIRDRAPGKLFVTRHFSKALDLQWLKPLLGRSCRFVYEAHEDAFPHLLASPPARELLKKKTEKIFRLNDGLLLNNFSQEMILQQEFTHYPPRINLPNGVDLDGFAKAVPPPWRAEGPFVVTYVGQFTAWKNCEMLFAALARLDARFTLRIAGGKGGAQGFAASQAYVTRLVEQYGLAGRVDFRGFVQPRVLVEEVLKGSSVLTLPMGDNMRARYLTSPLKLFEAMATGIPLVAVDFPSVNLVIGPETAFLCQPNPDDFARAIREAALEEERTARIQRMNAIAQQFTHTRRAERYHRWLTETLSP